MSSEMFCGLPDSEFAKVAPQTGKTPQWLVEHGILDPSWNDIWNDQKDVTEEDQAMRKNFLTAGFIFVQP